MVRKGRIQINQQTVLRVRTMPWTTDQMCNLQLQSMVTHHKRHLIRLLDGRLRRITCQKVDRIGLHTVRFEWLVGKCPPDLGPASLHPHILTPRSERAKYFGHRLAARIVPARRLRKAFAFQCISRTTRQ